MTVIDSTKIALALLESDTASKSLGMSVNPIGLGQVQVSMTITQEMINGHKTCHGGYIFTLADSAFAFAANSANRRTVAQHCTISYVQPAYENDCLTATAEKRNLSKRNGIYDVSVRNQNNEIIAEFRGYSREIGGRIVE